MSKTIWQIIEAPNLSTFQVFFCFLSKLDILLILFSLVFVLISFFKLHKIMISIN